MQVQHPFRTVTPTLDGDVLAVLAGADAAFTPPQVHRLIGSRSEAGVRKVLRRLVEQGVVTDVRVGQAVSYRLNRDHLAAPYITGLAHLYHELLDRIRAELDGWKTPAVFVGLFGSLPRHEMRPDSDIDLFVARPDDVPGDDPDWRDQLDRLAERVTAWTGNDARVMELRHSEAQSAVQEGQQVFEDMRAVGVRLHGPTGYLKRHHGRASS